tara:strand:+ start:872 stop:1135 length:264 start_codon:yes stop_codon:yes gene_type:complete
MKNLKRRTFALSILIALLCVGCNGSAELHGNKLLIPTNVYEVDGWGSNPDIYEFTPEGHLHMTCLILTSGGDSANGLECFPKKSSDT